MCFPNLCRVHSKSDGATAHCTEQKRFWTLLEMRNARWKTCGTVTPVFWEISLQIFFFFFAVVSDWLPSRGAAHSAWKYFSVYKVLLCAGRTSSFLLYPPCSRFIFFFTPVEGPTIRRVINASLQICHSNRKNKEEQIASVAYTSISIPAVMPLSDLSFLSLDLAKVPFLGVWPEFSQG